MSSERFETLEEDLEAFFQVLQKKLDSRLERCQGEEKRQILSELERDLDEAKQTIFDLEAEARSAPAPFRNDMMKRVRTHRETLIQYSMMTKSAKQAEVSMAATRSALFDNRSIVYPQNRGVDDAIQRTVQQGTQILERTSQSIYRSTQVALETEEIGTGVIRELGEQREALIRTRDRLADTDIGLGRSRRILNSMYRAAITNKLVLIVIIILEIVILIGLIYYKFFS